MKDSTLRVPSGFDLNLSLRTLAVGTFDADGTWWLATGTQSGNATVALQRRSDDVYARAWGSGSEAVLETIPRLTGIGDPYDLPNGSGRIRDLIAHARGMRLGSTGRVYEALVQNVLAQVVTTKESKRSLRSIIRAYGEPADGPRANLNVFPDPTILAALSHDELHSHGVERKRASVVIEVARRAKRMEEILSMDVDDAVGRLLAVRGVGPWTAANVMGQAYGDRDAVPVGDYHLPNTVAWALAGEPRGTDDRMLELLEPYRPVRRHVLMAIKLSGVTAPKYGPKTALRRHL